MSPARGVVPANGTLQLKVSVKPERMAERRIYRGAFLVMAAGGLEDLEFVTVMDVLHRGGVPVASMGLASDGATGPVVAAHRLRFLPARFFPKPRSVSGAIGVSRSSMASSRR